jgi:hypothetical protein
MTTPLMRRVSIAAVAMCLLASVSGAQPVQWEAKAGINSTSVGAVPDYYDWVLCCHPLFPDAMVDATSAVGFTVGVAAAFPIASWYAVQGELLFSRRRHSVDFRPYEAIDVGFTRDYVEAAGLMRLEHPVTGQGRIFVAGGPVIGFRVGERAESSDPMLRRGDPQTNIYVVQALVYSAPEVLRRSQASVALTTGGVYRRFLVEIRLTQGLQSIFKDRDGLVAGFVEAGGHEPTLRRLVADFGPFLESAKNRDLAVLAGIRF